MKKITLSGLSEKSNVAVLSAKLRRRVPPGATQIKHWQSSFRGKVYIEIDYEI